MSAPADTGDTAERIGVREFRANLTAILRRARDGQAFLVTSHDEVLAELRPPPPPRGRRRPGTLRGQIWMAPDFDELPDDILDAMERREE